jgi:uncharacterized protein
MSKHGNLAIIALLIAAGGAACSSAIASPLPGSWLDACILRPVRCASGSYQIKDVDGVSCTDVFFPSGNGNELHGWYLHKPQATRTVLLSHGIGGNVSSRVDLIHLFLQANASVFIYDYQGYGKSHGVASLRNVIDDGQAAYRFLTGSLKVSPQDVVLVGESLGTGVTTSLSQKVNAAAMILQSPFSSLSKRVGEVVPFLRARQQWLDPIAPLSNDQVLSHPHIPVLIVHGTRDTTVPVHHAIDLFNQAVGPKTLLVIKGAGHTGDRTLMYSPLYLEAVRTFFHQLDTDGQQPEQRLHISSISPAQ